MKEQKPSERILELAKIVRGDSKELSHNESILQGILNYLNETQPHAKAVEGKCLCSDTVTCYKHSEVKPLEHKEMCSSASPITDKPCHICGAVKDPLCHICMTNEFSKDKSMICPACVNKPSSVEDEVEEIFNDIFSWKFEKQGIVEPMSFGLVQRKELSEHLIKLGYSKSPVPSCECVYEHECGGIEMIKSPSGKEWAIGGTRTKDRWKFCPWCGGVISGGKE